MPSTYAHYRMGQQVRSMLDGNEKKIVEKYPQLYLIGLHGPDILFYYKPLKSNSINSIGYELHKHSYPILLIGYELHKHSDRKSVGRERV